MSRLPTEAEMEDYDPYAIPNSGPIAFVDNQTEQANARRLVGQHADSIFYVPDWKAWFHHINTHWVRDNGTMIEQKALAIADNNWDEVKEELPSTDRNTAAALISYARAMSSARGIQATVKIASSIPGVARSHNELDTDPFVLNVENGTLDLKTGDLRPHNPRDLITKLAPVKFDQKADCPTWRKFIDDVFCGAEELIRYVQRLAGYSLTGSTKDHVLPFLYGQGANGKSTFVNVLMDLLGNDYAMKCAPDLLMVKGDTHPVERADLWGRRLAVSNEIESGRRLAESLAKDMSGGDKIRARRLYENFWEFYPTHKLWLCGNHRPRISGDDFGIWRRIKLIPFNRTFLPEEQDRDLPEKLKAEASGILNWLLVGCLSWQGGGLDEPDIVAQATAAYRDTEDVVTQFIAERCVVLDDCRVKASELYATYKAWAEANGERAMGNKVFGEKLGKRFERFTNNGTWYRGIGLESDEWAPTEPTEG